MQIYGREVGFRFTVGASAKISDLCPDGDISRLGEVLEGHYGKVARDSASIIAALSEGYEEARAFEIPGYKPQPLTVEEVLTLRMDEFAQLQQAALTAWMEDSKSTVEVEPEKKSRKAQASS
uniref:Uncharacterized protein n=1 Tax=Siphoviridae sp. ctRSW19 TaxID=2825503 RepID=A0A8S5U536_9CAUD|nr:MAG TPA: hypothetical protein [Siphoviridae sp. ctRSW19]